MPELLKLLKLPKKPKLPELPKLPDTLEPNADRQATPKAQSIFAITYCPDPKLNSRIEHLHTLARQGGYPWIQPYIDAHLPAVAYLQQNPSSTTHQINQMILSPTDAPQLGALPDITPILRAMLLQTDMEKCGFILTPLYSALPCIRRPTTRKAQPQPEQDTHQVAICILLALLLGLYPTSVKFPPFPIRVSLYRRIHSLLTNGQGVGFCKAHPCLLTLALMEYGACVIPSYLPAEHEILSGENGMRNFFSTCPLACDAFRQEALQTGEETWAELEAYCIPIVERHSRACKSRQRTRQPDQFPVVKLSPQDTQRLCHIPFIVPYSIHNEDQTNCIMASEMAFLGLDTLDGLRNHNSGTRPIVDHTDFTSKISSDSTSIFSSNSTLTFSPNSTSNSTSTTLNSTSGCITDSTADSNSSTIKHEQAVAMQRTVHIHQLPPNLTDIQLRALSSRMKLCERSALSCSVLYVCISCIMANQQTICRKGRAFPTRGQCKLDLDTDTLLCSVCQSHSIISVSTLGRIISLRNYRFYLAPCCSTVQIYTGRGDEFQALTDSPCSHKQAKAPPKTAKRRCEICSNVALPEPHVSVDHLNGEQHHTHLCQRHTPHSDALKHVTNWTQLQEEILKRDRPLFTIRYSGRRGGDGDD